MDFGSCKSKPRLSTQNLCFLICFGGLAVFMWHKLLGFAFDMNQSDLVGQDEPELIELIRQSYLKLPPKTDYDLREPNVKDPSQNGQGKFLAELFNEKTNGTFLEAGAYNGEELSNTLYLERFYNWTGLLVEADPWNFESMRKISRKAILSNTCLSPEAFPMEVTFRQSDAMGQIEDSPDPNKKGIFTPAKCFPIYSLMVASNLTSLDLLSLDVEGFELKVLMTIPWDDVAIKVICIEHKHTHEGYNALMSFLTSEGYMLTKKIGDDLIFIRDSEGG